MTDILHDHTILIGGRNISNLRFAYNIDPRAGSNKELQVLTNRLVESSKASNGMDINHEKSKKMVNSNRNQKANINLERISLENVESFKYLGTTL